MSIRSLMYHLARRIRRRILRLRLPRVVAIRDFDVRGVNFELKHDVEIFRVLDHGGETDYIASMLSRLRPNDVFWDVGASVGLVALHAGRICKVFAFEPDPAIRARLDRNLGLNEGLDVEILPFALSNEDGPVELFTAGAAGYSPSLRHQRTEFAAIEVEGRSADSLIAEGCSAPTVLKLDIEGAEILALRGGTRLLAGEAPPRLIYLELHGSMLPAFESTGEEVLDVLRSAGYAVTEAGERDEQEHFVLEQLRQPTSS